PTPLSWATAGGHWSVVKQLLERRDVNPGEPDNDGPAPLHLATACGYESVVQPLDRRGINPDKLDYKGGTPLLSTASKGRVSIVEQFADREDVNSDRLDYARNSSASWAAISFPKRRGYSNKIRQKRWYHHRAIEPLGEEERSLF